MNFLQFGHAEIDSTRVQIKSRVDAIRSGAVYVCDVIQDEILETLFSRQELNYRGIILEGEVESSDDESGYNYKT